MTLSDLSQETQLSERPPCEMVHHQWGNLPENDVSLWEMEVSHHLLTFCLSVVFATPYGLPLGRGL